MERKNGWKTKEGIKERERKKESSEAALTDKLPNTD